MSERIPDLISDSLFEVRHKLWLHASGIVEKPIKMEGVELLATADSRPLLEDCEMFVFGNRATLRNLLQSSQFEIADPRMGDYVCYFDDNGFQHVGKVMLNNMVVSKWGVEGHVYFHKKELVPLDYGHKMKYYRP